MRWPFLLSAAFCLLAVPFVSANQSIPPWAPFKAGAKTFTFSLAYSGQQDKPFYSLMLTVQPVPSTAVSEWAKYTCITEQEATKLIEALMAAGFFRDSVDTAKQPLAQQDGYTLTVTTGEGAAMIRRAGALGFDLRTLAQMDAMRKAMDGDAAKGMETLLARLSGLRKTWTDEGRVFAHRGLVALIEDPAPIPIGQPVVFEVTLRNESNAAMTLPQDPQDIDAWNINIQGPDQTEYYVVRPGRPPGQPQGKPVSLDPSKSITLKLSITGCKYYIKPKAFPAKMIGLDTLPKGKYSFELSTEFTTPQSSHELTPAAWTGSLNAAPLAVEITGQP